MDNHQGMSSLMVVLCVTEIYRNVLCYTIIQNMKGTTLCILLDECCENVFPCWTWSVIMLSLSLQYWRLSGWNFIYESINCACHSQSSTKYTYIRTYAYTYICTYIHTHVRAYIHTYTHNTCIHTYKHLQYKCTRNYCPCIYPLLNPSTRSELYEGLLISP